MQGNTPTSKPRRRIRVASSQQTLADQVLEPAAQMIIHTGQEPSASLARRAVEMGIPPHARLRVQRYRRSESGGAATMRAAALTAWWREGERIHTRTLELAT